MLRAATTILALALIGLLQPFVLAVEPPEDSKASQGDRALAALKLGLPLVEKAAMRYPEHRKCFSCHHQTLPMMAMVAARGAGVPLNETVLGAQADFSHASFTAQLKDLRDGEGIGGKGLTVGYGLLALSLAERPADETTAAMVTYLLKTQNDDGHWHVHAHRPPMEDSLETTTAIAAAGLRKYGPSEAGETKDQVDAAIAKAKTWLAAAQPKSTEDKVARLWGLHSLGASDDELQAARSLVLKTQRADGGWPQLDQMDSDAYATGQALSVLLSTGLAPTAPECQRGIEFLLATQKPDGSWHVKSRSKPIQVMFDNGDPHGTDQFISTPATCWALTALALWQKQ
jgi:N-acyl-D-amino-acid deacylase